MLEVQGEIDPSVKTVKKVNMTTIVVFVVLTVLPWVEFQVCIDIGGSND